MSATIISAPPVRGAFADRELDAVNGYVMLAIGLASIAICCWLAYIGLTHATALSFEPGLVCRRLSSPSSLPPASSWDWSCFSRTRALSVYCSEVTSALNTGLAFGGSILSIPRKVSRRLETLESGPLKVNDAVGNPIDIGAVIVWRVEDAAKALLEVASYASYVKAQSETALRRMVSVHPYDQVETEEADRQGEPPASGAGKPGHDRAPVSTVSLRDGGDAVIEALLQEIRARMEPIGVSVLEARISHLAYSSEIAGAMLRKQAASAVLAARRMIVRGAVSIVEDALDELDRKKLAEALDPERKAAMISNLLVVLVGDREVTPVINTGTLYS